MRTVLIDDVLLILLVDDFLDADDVVPSLVLLLLGHLVDLHEDLVLPLLADGVPALFVFIYVLLAGFDGPGFGLDAAAFVPLDGLSSADLAKAAFAETCPMVDYVESVGVTLEDAETIFFSDELLEVILD